MPFAQRLLVARGKLFVNDPPKVILGDEDAVLRDFLECNRVRESVLRFLYESRTRSFGTLFHLRETFFGTHHGSAGSAMVFLCTDDVGYVCAKLPARRSLKQLVQHNQSHDTQEGNRYDQCPVITQIADIHRFRFAIERRMIQPSAGAVVASGESNGNGRSSELKAR